MNKEFEVHMLNEAGKAKAREIAEAFDACLDRLAVICPAGRETKPRCCARCSDATMRAPVAPKG